MPYQDLNRIKLRLSKQFKAEKFFTDDPVTNFDLLLVELEKESRAIIESYKDDVSFAETVYTDEIMSAPFGSRLPLVYPVVEVNKIEYRRHQDMPWREMEPRLYRVTKHGVMLRRVPRRRDASRSGIYKARNPLLDRAHRLRFIDFGEEIRITYTAGHDPIPADVLHIQIRLINNMLTELRKDQTHLPADPRGIMESVREERIFTEDIKRLLDHITRHHGTVGVI